MYILILLAVISSLSTMVLAFQFEKNLIKPEETKVNIKLWHILVSSILFGSFGAFFATIGFYFQKDNKKFILLEILLVIVHTILIIFVPKII